MCYRKVNNTSGDNEKLHVILTCILVFIKVYEFIIPCCFFIASVITKFNSLSFTGFFTSFSCFDMICTLSVTTTACL